ncbi:solute carrier family 25 member 45-like isoform X4 [Rhodnius prolixus]|uniref:solute carrier family 25 member 45-like isoform X4 n=1 Tax=Rhodnius prolixus TaxID=13249 RepID=UPI003D18E7A0
MDLKITSRSKGIVGLAVGHPLDTVKVRQQTFKEHGMIRIFLSTYRNEGIRGFYRGLLFPALSAGAYNSLFFGNFGFVLNLLEYSDSPTSLRKFCCEWGPVDEHWHRNVIIAGAVAGATTTIVGAPIELIKTQLQVKTDPILSRRMRSKEEITGPYSCAKYIFKLGGIRALYTGGWPLLLRDTPGFSLYIVSYEHIVCLLQGKMEPEQRPKIVHEIIAGGFAGIISWIFLMPMDVVKSRMQADNLSNPKYKGVVDCLLKSYQEEGRSIFMKGMWVTVLRAFPTNATTFAVFQLCLETCQDFSRLVFPEAMKNYKK